MILKIAAIHLGKGLPVLGNLWDGCLRYEQKNGGDLGIGAGNCRCLCVSRTVDVTGFDCFHEYGARPVGFADFGNTDHGLDLALSY